VVTALRLISLLGFEALLIGLPVFLQSLLSRVSTSHTIYFQYVATITPFIFMGALFGVQRLLRWCDGIRWVPRALGVGLVVAAGITQVLWGPWVAGPAPLGRSGQLARDALDDHRAALIARIPSEAGVIATFQFLPALSRRAHLFGFHDAYLNRSRTGDAGPYVMPEEATYALLDLNDPMLATYFLHRTIQM